MRRALFAGTALVAVLSATLLAQSTPNFSGKWTLVAEPNAPPPMGGLGTSAVVTQDASTLTIARTTQMGEFTMVYKLDGTESKNTVNMGGNSVDQISKAKWDGGKLLIETSMNFAGTPVNVKASLWFDATGNLLVESVRPDFQGGGPDITTKATYKKN